MQETQHCMGFGVWSGRQGIFTLVKSTVTPLNSGLRIWHCCELWCGCRCGSSVVYASSCSSNWTSSLGTSICRRGGPKKKKKKKKTKTNKQKPHLKMLLALTWVAMLVWLCWDYLMIVLHDTLSHPSVVTTRILCSEKDGTGQRSKKLILQ